MADDKGAGAAPDDKRAGAVADGKGEGAVADDKGAGTVPNGKRANVWPGKRAPAPERWSGLGRGLRNGRGAQRLALYSSSLSTARKASVGIWTEPRERIFFLPSFCFSSSFFFRVMSPP